MISISSVDQFSPTVIIQVFRSPDISLDIDCSMSYLHVLRVAVSEREREGGGDEGEVGRIRSREKEREEGREGEKERGREGWREGEGGRGREGGRE